MTWFGFERKTFTKVTSLLWLTSVLKVLFFFLRRIRWTIIVKKQGGGGVVLSDRKVHVDRCRPPNNTWYFGFIPSYTLANFSCFTKWHENVKLCSIDLKKKKKTSTEEYIGAIIYWQIGFVVKDYHFRWMFFLR